MKPKSYLIRLDAYKGVLNPQNIVFTTDDNSKCVLNFELLEDKITAYDLSSCLVKLVSNASQQQDCDIISASNGEVTITLRQSMITTSGIYQAEVQIYDATNQILRVTFPKFEYTINRSLMSDETVQADPNFSILQDMIANVGNTNTLADEALETADNAVTQANSAVDTINTKVAEVDTAVIEVNTLKNEMSPFLGDLAVVKTKVEDIADGATKDEYVLEIPAVINRKKNTFYYKFYMDNGIRKIAWIEDWLGNKYSIHDYQTKLITMNADGIFPTTPCANSYVRGLTVKGQTYIQELVNGNFANGITGWTGFGATVSASNNVLSTVNGAIYSNPASCASTNIKGSLNKKFYIRQNVRVTNSSATKIEVRLYTNDLSANLIVGTVLNPVANQWYVIRGIVTLTSAFVDKYMSIYIHNHYVDVTTANGKVMEVQDVMLLDLDKNPSLSTLTADEINTRLPRYIPYGLSSTGDLDIPTNPLRILPNGVRDTIDDKATGAVTRRTKKVTIDGSIFTRFITGTNMDRILTPMGVKAFSDQANTDPSVINYNVRVDNLEQAVANNWDNIASDGKYSFNSASEMMIIFRKGRFANLDEARNFYSGKSTLTYQLATPYTETYNPSTDFKIYILTSINDVMQRVQISDYLRKVGTVSDSLVNGVLTRNHGKILLNGSESNWNIVAWDGIATMVFTIPISNVIANQVDVNTICDKFASYSRAFVSTSDIEGVCANTTISVRILKSKLATQDVAGFKAWLALNNISVVYRLATPIYETVDITPVQTVQGDNIIKNLNSVLPSEETITVYQTSDQVKTDQDAKIVALQNAILLLQP